jgi:acyl-CoA synthetase (NDP forming)
VQHSINVHSASDALVAAETLGLPVTLHVNTPDDFPAARCRRTRSVRDAPSVRTAYRELEQQMQQDFPRARVSGVGVQRCARWRRARTAAGDRARPGLRTGDPPGGLHESGADRRDPAAAEPVPVP